MIWKKAIRATVPVMSGYLVLGAAFGMLLRTQGLPAWAGSAMSLFIYAGSLQYVLIGLLASGASLLTVALTSLAVNARHLFYGLSMLEKYRDAGLRKPYLIFALTDETYSLVCAVPEEIPAQKRLGYCFLVTVFDHFWWVAGTLLGIVAGEFLHFPTEGMDFALTALFLTVVTGQWLENRDRRPAIGGFAASLLALWIFGKDAFLIPAMCLIAAYLTVLYVWDKKKGAAHE